MNYEIFSSEALHMNSNIAEVLEKTQPTRFAGRALFWKEVF